VSLVVDLRVCLWMVSITIDSCINLLCCGVSIVRCLKKLLSQSCILIYVSIIFSTLLVMLVHVDHILVTLLSEMSWAVVCNFLFLSNISRSCLVRFSLHNMESRLRLHYCFHRWITRSDWLSDIFLFLQYVRLGVLRLKSIIWTYESLSTSKSVTIC
jgi:hypothetical protein